MTIEQLVSKLAEAVAGKAVPEIEYDPETGKSYVAVVMPVPTEDSVSARRIARTEVRDAIREVRRNSDLAVCTVFRPAN